MHVNIPGCEVYVSVDDDGGIVLRIVGELDLATVAVVRDAVESVPLIGVPRLVLDVTDLSFISAAGVRVALDAQRRLTQHGGRLVLRGPNALVRRVLQATRLDDQFEIDDEPLHD